MRRKRITSKRAEPQAYLKALDVITDQVEMLPYQIIHSAPDLLRQAKRDLHRVFQAWLDRADPDAGFTFDSWRKLIVAMRRDGRSVKRLPPWVPGVAVGLRHTLTQAAPKVAHLATAHVASQTHVVATQSVIVNATKVVHAAVPKLASRHAVVVKRTSERLFEDVKQRVGLGANRETNAQLVRRLADVTVRESREFTRAIVRDGERELEFMPVAAESVATSLVTRMQKIIDIATRNTIVGDYNTVIADGLFDVANSNADLVWLKRWDATLDAAICEECSELHGEVVELEEEFSNGCDHPDPAFGDPHYGCRCFLTVWTEPRA